MLIDITLKITSDMLDSAILNEKRVFNGRIGTHFDVMDKVFPLEYTLRRGIIFDVSHINNREITINDINTDLIKENDFVIFYSGFINKETYGSKTYFKEHPELSNELIDYLINKKISLIGIDFAGVKRGSNHPKVDQYVSNYNIFIIENLCSLDKVLNNNKYKKCYIHTYPMNIENTTGLPCRVICEV